MNYKKFTVFIGLLAIVSMTSLAMKPFESAPSLKLALLKYNGGGDWYANPSALVNLSLFCNKFLNTNFDPNYETVEVGSIDLYNYPFLHMTGHGNVVFSTQEADNLRTYLTSGGFLHIDDNYGMDPYVRVAMKSVFPELEFVEVPFNHGIYHQKYEFPGGLPKIHKHDDRAPKGYGLFWQGRLVCYYSFECDLGDGWEDPEVHKDPEELRIKALRMGANLVQYVFRA
ncbi:MAG TPA: DUF4159 domain-containing protein [Saprospiraceae bacterium]|nr:DUF4159 domain-containing protein [Saprospiraceae bacterium]HPN70156.1 DUF4159 domain-containing protein [Saprospiraceae bacterium]